MWTRSSVSRGWTVTCSAVRQPMRAPQTQHASTCCPCRTSHAACCNGAMVHAVRLVQGRSTRPFAFGTSRPVHLSSCAALPNSRRFGSPLPHLHDCARCWHICAGTALTMPPHLRCFPRRSALNGGGGSQCGCTVVVLWLHPGSPVLHCGSMTAEPCMHRRVCTDAERTRRLDPLPVLSQWRAL